MEKLVLNETREIQSPRIFIELNEDNNSLKLHHTNHWSDAIQFDYFFSGSKGQESVWTASV
ncbi:MAG: hypothetical protein EBS24_07665 [Chitinophagia bacterium]|nr:hypothetical protein [Chitinophagia bacterium]